MKLKNIFLSAVLVSALCACDDMFKPAIENNHSEEAMLKEPDYAQGLLGYAYAILPYETKSNWDVATDDAVTNDKSSGYISMSLGSWSSDNNPMSQWDARKCAIQYINLFLNVVERVSWSTEATKQEMFIDKLKGEAYALRALHYYYLLMAHGGYGTSGTLLGVPMLMEPENGASDFNVARNTFAECVALMLEDLNNAIDLLPTDYVDLKVGEEGKIPAKYREKGAALGAYNLVFGAKAKNRMSGRIAEAIKAQVALLAVSPAFADGSGVTSEEAANYAAVVLKRINGVSGMDPEGHKWYINTSYLDDLGKGDIAEIVWRGDRTNGKDSWDMGLDQEASNFAPTLYGKGRINPSQNLVDAFPMENGYPITDARSGYDPVKPYAGRDPRLGAYVIYDGSTYKKATITTGSYGSTDDAINRIDASTRTGYYLKKLLREDCDPNPSTSLAQYHFPIRIRYTEIFLAYAEAANQAWGPTGSGSNGFSAYDVIKAIRQRAGVGKTNGDPYLESVKGNKDQFAELIRNERRLELCFENKRFWDMRRWKLSLNEAVKGVDWKTPTTPTYIEVEKRQFSDYQCYGPIPKGEVDKWSNLEQNKGW
ncbi:MAG: RagB/SusD family nutrient uptake outer membrane protein [Bacteroidaceae bacterium]|nr:RagB/SusD family nutrient uptake outer membrane protein [Bacteroidaceae bacterium]